MLIGEGSFGKVYDVNIPMQNALNLHPGRYAIKVFQKSFSDFVASSYWPETSTTDGMYHERLNMKLAIGTNEYFKCIVLPFANGQTLESHAHDISRTMPHSICRILSIIYDVAYGLHVMSMSGLLYMVHGDLKMKNILMHDDRAVRADFGTLSYISDLRSVVVTGRNGRYSKQKRYHLLNH
ncbi:unnamed protein product [Cuscuta epithymum]|uniref:Protein kinase domain-containing protein n=1 Tax=Cuscuta epithymum TaxID=186058 RepID=A0AAV0CVU6_9ASTE|nr:unnamed protein product [Cuscuta epithymum]CAH9142273.1 unnamed protein product [Cuscuta epithymum]